MSALFKKPFIFGYPPFLSIETNNNCNLACPQCPTGRKELKREIGSITIELYEKIINEAKSTLSYLNLYFQGEPFLHSRLFEIIAYATQKNIYTTISTNGHYLDIKNCKKIIQSKLSKIIISLDGATEETYKKYRIMGNYNKVVEGIKNLVSHKKRFTSKFPFIELQFIVFKHNEDEIKAINKLGKELEVDAVRIKTAQIIHFNDVTSYPLNNKYSRYKRDKKQNIELKNNSHNCWRLWSNPVITWNGNIIPCCYDKDGEYAFGNITNQSLFEQWTGIERKKLLRKFLSNRKDFDMCSNCHFK